MGESAAYVLKGIEDMLQTEVKYFSMVRKDGERMYICLGKRALFLIDFEPPFQEFFYYAWVRRVIIDSDNLLLFQVDFHEGRPSLLLESFERSRLCDELAICWKADSMFRQWRWQPFPLKKGQCELGRRDRARTAVEFTRAPDKMKRIEFRGYQLFLDDAYREDALGPDGMPTGRFRATGRDRELVTIVEPAATVAGLGRREKHNLRLAAERMARGKATDSEMMVLRSEQYHKKMNLVGDLASYGCWAVHLRTPQRDVGVVSDAPRSLSRRTHAPPRSGALRRTPLSPTHRLGWALPSAHPETLGARSSPAVATSRRAARDPSQLHPAPRTSPISRASPTSRIPAISPRAARNPSQVHPAGGRHLPGHLHRVARRRRYRGCGHVHVGA